MKKVAFCAAAAAMCGSLLAVESANIVGYANSEFDQGGWMIPVGVAFSNVGSLDGSFTIGETAFTGTAAEGDQMITFDGDVWNLNQYDKQGTGDGWYLTPADGSDPEIIASITLPKGGFVYYIPASGEALTIAGEVADPSVSQSVTFDLDNEAGQWMFPLVNPFPVDTTWGEINTFTHEGDQIITFDGDAWNLNQYDRQGDGDGWYLTPADGSDPEIVNDDDAVLIPAGAAVYYIPAQTTTWTVTL